MTSIVGLIGTLSLVASASSPPEGVAVEFEAVGEEVGWGGLPSRIRHVPTDVVLVLIPPGKFTMGSPETEKQRDRDEEQREVAFESPFYLGETEVTIAQWTQVMKELPLELEKADAGALPVQGVTWYEAKGLVKLLNDAGSPVWRLPSEAEWEYACRAGTTSPFSFGANITPSQVNYNGRYPYADGEPGLNREEPVPVRTLPPNEWGLYEMHGNVWEWCEDLYAVHPALDAAKDVEGASRVLRGGAWTSRGKQTRSANRDGYPPSSSGPKYGLRLAVSIAAVK